jgi:hypothetical protein
MASAIAALVQKLSVQEGIPLPTRTAALAKLIERFPPSKEDVPVWLNMAASFYLEQQDTPLRVVFGKTILGAVVKLHAQAAFAFCSQSYFYGILPDDLNVPESFSRPIRFFHHVLKALSGE